MRLATDRAGHPSANTRPNIGYPPSCIDAGETRSRITPLGGAPLVGGG